MTAAETTYDQELGALIRLYRVARGQSEPDLARASGLTGDEIRRIERGLDGFSVRQLEELAHALGVRPSRLLDQLGERLNFLDHADPGVDRRVLDWLASNRGRQILRAMATTRRPEVLDAVANLLLASTTTTVGGDGEGSVG